MPRRVLTVDRYREIVVSAAGLLGTREIGRWSARGVSSGRSGMVCRAR